MMDGMNVIVDPEFKALISPLRAAELAGLEASLLADGCRDALVVWRSSEGMILIDGHNRFGICQKHALDYRVEEIDFEDRLAARIWIRQHALSQRNLSNDQRAMQAAELQADLSEQAKRERAQAGRAVGGRRRPDEDRLPPTGGDKRSTKLDTRKEAAEAQGVSRKQVEKAIKVRRADPELAQAVSNGTITLASAVREVKRREVVAHLEDVEAQEAKAIEGVYDVIVIDPPWPMKKIERDERPNQVAFDYPTMTEDELAGLSIPAATDAHVWLWTTHKFFPMALRLLGAWRLKYVCTFVWHKPGGFQPIGLPQYNCEFALYARRGAPQFVATKGLSVCFEAPRGRHSEKPEAFYKSVRRVTGGRRLDMFSRRTIVGFDGWGKEAAI